MYIGVERSKKPNEKSERVTAHVGSAVPRAHHRHTYTHTHRHTHRHHIDRGKWVTLKKKKKRFVL